MNTSSRIIRAIATEDHFTLIALVRLVGFVAYRWIGRGGSVQDNLEAHRLGIIDENRRSVRSSHNRLNSCSPIVRPPIGKDPSFSPPRRVADYTANQICFAAHFGNLQPLKKDPENIGRIRLRLPQFAPSKERVAMNVAERTGVFQSQSFAQVTAQFRNQGQGDFESVRFFFTSRRFCRPLLHVPNCDGGRLPPEMGLRVRPGRWLSWRWIFCRACRIARARAADSPLFMLLSHSPRCLG
jgi:hypothetical protein